MLAQDQLMLEELVGNSFLFQSWDDCSLDYNVHSGKGHCISNEDTLCDNVNKRKSQVGFAGLQLLQQKQSSLWL